MEETYAQSRIANVHRNCGDSTCRLRRWRGWFEQSKDESNCRRFRLGNGNGWWYTRGSCTTNSYTASSLSLDAIQDDLLIFENLSDHRGKKINRKGSCKLIVANPALEWKLAEIFGSIMNPDTANNAINSLVKSRPSLKFMCTPYITSTTGRYYIGETSPIRGAISFMRRPVTFAREGDFNTGDSLFKVTYRMSVGCADPMNIALNAGA